MSYPIFSSSSPFVGPDPQPHPSKCFLHHLFFEFPALKIEGGIPACLPNPTQWWGWGGGPLPIEHNL